MDSGRTTTRQYSEYSDFFSTQREREYDRDADLPQREMGWTRRELEPARKHTPAVALWTLRRSGFTSMLVPRYSGKSNREQYREVFEAIVRSNGWDDVTAALQLLSHLDGDALNVALLVPESRQVVIRSLQRSRASGRIQASVSAGVPVSGG